MKIILVEDEKYTADLIVRLAHQYDPEIEIVKVFSNVSDSVKWFILPPVSVDLILMDVQLSDGISFDIFEQATIETPVIFITAFNEYALKAFKVNSIDYLLKPIDYNDLEKAFDKYFKMKSSLAVTGSQHYGKIFSEGIKPYKSRFLVKFGDYYKFIKTSSVASFSYSEGVVSAWLFTGNQQVIDETLDELERLLDPGKFYRLNRKVIVSVEAISSIQNYFNRRLAVRILPDERQEIVSRERVAGFKEWMNF